MDEILTLQADVLKTLSNAHRLEIIEHLAHHGASDVTRLAEDIGMNQPSVSQHLAVLRAAGLVEAVRNGREVHYHLSDPEVADACRTMQRVLMRRLARLGALSTRATERFDNPLSV